VNIPQDDKDLNAQYEEELEKFRAPPPKEERTMPKSEEQEHYYKGFRSAVVLIWVFCNFALGAVVLSAAGLENLNSSQSLQDTETQRASIYMAVVLWSVAALSLFRFIGALWFLVVRLVSSTPIVNVPVAYGLLVPRRLSVGFVL
jgi:chitin synthase